MKSATNIDIDTFYRVSACASLQSTILVWQVTWLLKTEDELALHQAEMKIRRMCVMRLSDKLSCTVCLGIQVIAEVLQRNRL